MSVSQLCPPAVSGSTVSFRRRSNFSKPVCFSLRSRVLKAEKRPLRQHGNLQLTAGRWFWQRSAPQRLSPVSARNTKAVYDDEDWDEPAEQGGGLVSGIFGAAFAAINNVTDILMDIVPDSIPRSVVDLSVKAGMVLIVIGFARSVLSFALTLGTIVLGLYIAYQAFGPGSDSGKGFDGSRRGGSRGSRRRGTLRLPSTLPLPLPISRVEDDLADVWFEPTNKQRQRQLRQLRQLPIRGQQQQQQRRLPDRRERRERPW